MAGEGEATNGLPGFCSRHNLPKVIADEFQNGLVHLLPGAQRIERGGSGYTHVMGDAGTHARFAPLNKHRDDLWALVLKTTTALSEAFATTH